MIINLLGPPAAGKTTFASRYVLEHPYFRFCSIDAYRVENKDENIAWKRLYQDTINHSYVILESCGIDWKLKELFRSSSIKNRQVKHVAFRGSRHHLVERLNNRQQKRFIDYEYDLKDEFKAIDYVNEQLDSVRVDLVVETNFYTINEQYGIISTYIAEELVKENRKWQEVSQKLKYGQLRRKEASY